MRTISRDGEHELVINKSRFICAVSRVADEESARGFIAARRKLYWNASHNCTAYVLGDGGDVQRSSDDGEPAGTAGVPMLEVLRHRELTGVVAVVTRYFGGVKLGAGGLIRAYGNAVAAAVDAVGTVELVTMPLLTVTVDYQHGGSLEAELRRTVHRVLAVRYEEVIQIDVAAGTGLEEFGGWLAGQTAGAASFEVTGTTTVEGSDLPQFCNIYRHRGIGQGLPAQGGSA